MLFWIIPSVHVGFLLRMIHVLEHKLRELYGFLRHLTSVGDKSVPHSCGFNVTSYTRHDMVHK